MTFSEEDVLYWAKNYFDFQKRKRKTQPPTETSELQTLLIQQGVLSEKACDDFLMVRCIDEARTDLTHWPSPAQRHYWYLKYVQKVEIE